MVRSHLLLLPYAASSGSILPCPLAVVFREAFDDHLANTVIIQRFHCQAETIFNDRITGFRHT